MLADSGAMALYLVRHGATEWSKNGRHTGVTDLPLLPEGEDDARRMAARLAGHEFASVITSPRQRARRTAELAGFPDAVVDEDLVEWGYGEYEGISTVQIRETDPGWSIWTGYTPGGETAEEIAARLDRVIARAQACDGDVLAFAHGHCLRALAARWVEEPVSFGRFLVLGTATLSILGDDRGQAAVLTWNS